MQTPTLTQSESATFEEPELRPTEPGVFHDADRDIWVKDFSTDAGTVRKYYLFDEDMAIWRWVTGYMAVPNNTGDTKHMWDASKPDEVDAARALFKTLKSKGYAVYRAQGDKGDRGEIIQEFDPKAERLIFLPPMVGG